jgi:branched-subunit amino acid aminotransferase/4-amino-4-deoxychorismate lyase
MSISIIDEKQVFDKLLAQSNPYLDEYHAFYSSWFGGVVKNPRMMLIPIDDHMVHRGDGIFEAMKAVDRSIYLFEEHLDRLFLSAEKIALKIPLSRDELKQIVIDTLRVADQNETIIRIFISRGPGSFSVNPYETVGSQIYVAITKLSPPDTEKYDSGVRIGLSTIPVKSSWLAQIKSCNYLPNVLMKKETVDRGLDYVIGANDSGYITESATENIMIVDSNGILVHPALDDILKGTMMIRACELAHQNGIKTESRIIAMNELLSANEAMVTGTSMNVLPVVEFEGRKIGNGLPGLIAKKLNELIQQDIQSKARGTSY